MTTVISITQVSDLDDFKLYLDNAYPNFTINDITQNNNKLLISYNDSLTNVDINNISTSIDNYIYPFYNKTEDTINNSDSYYKYFHAFCNKTTYLDGTFKTIDYTFIKRQDSIYDYDKGVLTFLSSGLYFINFKVLIELKGDNYSETSDKPIESYNTFTSQSNVKLVSSIAGDVPGCDYLLQLVNYESTDISSGQIFLFYNATANETLQVKIKETSSNANVQLGIYNSLSSTLLNTTNSKFINLYNDADINLSTSYSDITFNNQRYIDADAFSHTISQESITINGTGTYFILISINSINYGTSEEHGQAIYNLLLDTGGGFNEIEASTAYSYNIYKNSVNGGYISNIYLLNAFNSGDVLKLRAKILDSSEIKISNINFLIWQQDNIKPIDYYNNSSLTINNLYKDIPLNTERNTHTNYTHATDSPELTVSENGTYFIFFKAITHSTNNQRSHAIVRLMNDVMSKGTFYEINNLNSITYIPKQAEGSYNTVSGHDVLYLCKNDKLKFQITSLLNNYTLDAYNFSVVIFKFENTIQGANNTLILNPYGTFCKNIKMCNNYLYSSNSIPIGYLLTHNIPTGTYRIGFVINLNVDDFDNITVCLCINYKKVQEFNYSKFYSSSISSFANLSLENGIYFIQIFLMNNNNNKLLHTVQPQLEFWRIN